MGFAEVLTVVFVVLDLSWLELVRRPNNVELLWSQVKSD